MTTKKNKATSSDVATSAAKLLSNPQTSTRIKSVAASALAQTVPGKGKKARGVRAEKVRSFKAGKDL